MAAFNFPSSPNNGDNHSQNGMTFTYSSSSGAWIRSSAVGAQGATGPTGAQGATGSTGPTGPTGAQGAANATTINSNTNNYLITGTGTANTLQGEANLNFDGTALGINISSPSAPLEIRGAGGTNDAAIYFRRDGSPPNNGVIGQLLFRKGTDSVAIIQALKESADDDAYISMLTQPTGGNVTERLRITSDGHVLFSGLTTKNDTRNAKGITLKSSSGGGGISFQNFGANGSRNWRIRPDDQVGWGTLEFSVSPTANSATDWPDAASDVVLALQPGREIETGTKTITGGTNLAIQNFKVKGVWSGGGSIGKEIELISGYDSAVKMVAIGYNLTDTSAGYGGSYGGDLVFHTQPLYNSPATPIPESMRIGSTGLITSPTQCAFEVKLNGDQSFTSGSTFRLNFNYVANQQGTTFDTGNNRFTAPATGYYQFNVGVYSYYSTYMELDGRCNGASTGAKTYRPTTRNSDGSDRNPGASMMASWLVKLTKGDYYEIFCRANSGSGTRNIYSDLNRTPTWWSGYLVC